VSREVWEVVETKAGKTRVTKTKKRRDKGRSRKEDVTNFIQLVFLQPVDLFSQTKLRWKVPNKGYLHICRMYKSNNK